MLRDLVPFQTWAVVGERSNRYNINNTTPLNHDNNRSYRSWGQMKIGAWKQCRITHCFCISSYNNGEVGTTGAGHTNARVNVECLHLLENSPKLTMVGNSSDIGYKTNNQIVMLSLLLVHDLFLLFSGLSTNLFD